ncbi:plasmid replication protein RepC [Methylobacterium gossipiicola]|uniref:Replication initiation protein RepC n=1 Tax=Methylobacterium gossipiicola TaxID=582675 RepID=A0A1I2USR2_9HYPH|nr:plasmid replication protein RepC [Methylobacterium gossipiicola]SFG77986.1 replication initiation protein RepC [Methylobacterium gossipiicola]
MNLHITTPFGRRPLTAAQIDAQANAAACPRDATVNKWAVFRHIAQAKDWIGVSDRSLSVLNALLSFHPETALMAGEGANLVVFPSNTQLALRAHGMTESTLRRHLAALVEAGLVIRRDSPNGKRYARKGQGGMVAQAFGFDLTPIVARAAEFEAQADRIQAERRALHLAREAVTILRRDAVKLILAGVEAGIAADWTGYRARYEAILGGLTRSPGLADLNAIRTALTDLVANVSKSLSVRQDVEKSNGSAAHSGRHNQNSKPKAFDSGKAPRNGDEGEGRGRPVGDSGTAAAYPLGMVLNACPDIVDYARNGIRSWRDLADVADLVRGMMGISPSAWRDAQDVMGPDAAAATMAAILQRAEHIKSPGGYLRTLVERKRAGRYSLGPVLLALTRARVSSMRPRS